MESFAPNFRIDLDISEDPFKGSSLIKRNFPSQEVTDHIKLYSTLLSSLLK